MARDGVYLYGYYGQGNLGDDLLLAVAVGMIRDVRPEAPIFVHCHDPERLPALGDERIAPVPASRLLADPARSRPARLLAHRAALAEAFERCDALVFGGGTVFQDAASPVSLMLIAATVAMARRRGLKVAAIGAGVGRLRTGVGRFAMRQVLQRADLFCIRDEASEAQCRALVPTAPLRRTADLVYALAPAAPQGERRGLALSIQPAIALRQDETGERTRAALLAAIEAAVAAGEACRLLAFETKAEGSSGLDDRAAWRQVAAAPLRARPDLVEVRTLEGGPEAAVGALAAARLHVGLRYHGHVLAALAGTPFVGLAHDVKVEAVCRSFAMPCLDAGAATPEAVREALGAAATRPIEAATLAALRRESAANGEALRLVLGERS